MTIDSTETPGLTSEEAQRRLAQYGPNAVRDETVPVWRSFLAKFWAPIPWLLELAIALQLAFGERIEAAMIAGLLLFNAILALLQEGRATAVLTALKGKLAPTALVRRDGSWARRPAAELVPGDLVQLPLGALIPADARLLTGSLLVDQSMLTGESVPVDRNVGDLVYAGGLVRRGAAVAEISATGTYTFFGRAAELVRVAHNVTAEQKTVFAATRNLALVNGTVAALILLYAYSFGASVHELIGLALTALLASIPVALPATFTLSAAIGAHALAQRGVLLTRLSAANEAASMDILCTDKTGTLTQNTLRVNDVAPLAGFSRERVLALGALASAEGEQDPIDACIRAAASRETAKADDDQLTRFTPFDPATRRAEAMATDKDGQTIRIVKGALRAVADVAALPPEAQALNDALAARGQRVIAVAAGPADKPSLVGFIALSDPPRADSAALIASLKEMGVRTVMVTGDSAVTGAAIARTVGIAAAVCPPEQLAAGHLDPAYGVFARVLPEDKYRLVQALQQDGATVGMCGDGTNDAPALRQAQVGIAVSSATDVAKAAAAMVLTEPGLAGIVFAVREGRIGFQRLLSYTLNTLVKKIEIVLFLAVGLVLTGHAILTPTLMVLLMLTNDFLSMSLTADRATPSVTPNRWRMRDITLAATGFGLCKLLFSSTLLAVAFVTLGLRGGTLQSFAFVTLVFGNQGMLYALRERRRLWQSRPGAWVLASSAVDIGVAALLSFAGILMAPLPWPFLAAILAAAALFSFVLDLVKLALGAVLKIE